MTEHLNVPIMYGAAIENSKIHYIVLRSKKTVLSKDNFQIRESVLTELLENNNHITTIRNFFVAFLLYLFANTVATDYFQNGKTEFGFRLIKYSFGKVHLAALFWIIFVVVSFLCYLCFKIWAIVRINLFPKSASLKLLDSSNMCLLIGYYIFTFYMPIYIIRTFDLPSASASVVLAEQLRMGMKIHAFIRSSVPKVLKYKPDDGHFANLPTFSNFAYFMFAPTMIYKDEYPRTKSIRWNFVACRMLELPVVILYYSMIFDQYMLPPFRDFGVRKFTWTEIFIAILKASAPAMVVVLLSFYIILHSVQNFFAEILRFGDRAFYGDWWTCTEYSEFYRKWNIIVHNWLYTFVYKDIKMLLPRSKQLALLSVFVLSALAHEWAFCNAMGIFFPAVTIEYVALGGIFYFIKVPKNGPFNVLFIYVLALGTSILLCFYSLEYYARTNVPIKVSDMWNRVLPGLLTCDCFQH